MVRGGYDGLGHLWFITAIFICYLTTPILQAFRNIASIALLLILGYGVLQYVVLKHDLLIFEPIFIYSIGYMFVNANKKVRTITLSILVIITTLVTLHIDWTQILKYDGIPNRMLHAFGGISFSLIFIITLSKFNNLTKSKIVAWFDRYSYEIYLLHHPFIIGPLSLIAVTPWLGCNIFIILSFTVMLSLLLAKFCNIINSNL